MSGLLFLQTAATEPLFEWSDVATELTGFIALFLMYGAVGFRFIVHRASRQSDFAPIESAALRRAALLGFIGSLINIAILAIELPAAAARQHVTLQHFLTASVRSAITPIGAVLAIIGFALALLRFRGAWWIAALGSVGVPLSTLVTGPWTRMINPLHRLGGGLWIGTLLVMVLAGFTTIMRSDVAANARGALTAALVNAFSPLALTSAAVLALSGVITAWRHLKRLSSLWTTPYGIALDVKLLFVLCVVALGAWNWRKQKPLLGSDEATASLRKSSVAELTFAAIVLVVTAIVVSLPSPQ